MIRSLGQLSRLAQNFHRASQNNLFLRFFSAKTYKNVLVQHQGKVAVITLNRPKSLNALCDELIKDLVESLKEADANEAIHTIVLTGSEKAFAAGADIKEMKDKTFANVVQGGFLTELDELQRIRKPIIAAVNGYALGGGCELAMMCDIIVAGANAKFGQPEITIGTIPGAGGTQRLVKAIGKSRAMELCLTGDQIDATEAERKGLVSKVVEPAKTVEEAVKVATKIANFSSPVANMVKESVNASFEVPLTAGLHVEKKIFYSTFGLEDRKEGMTAFAEKRKPTFKNK